jgi:diguanylate cyclase (GGDEF)-like protein
VVDDSVPPRLGDEAGFLRAVLRSLVDPVFVLDEDGRYLGVFGASERSQYDSPDYLVGRRLHDVMAAPVADGFLADIRRVIDTGQVHVTEYTLSSAQCEGNPQDGPPGLQWFQGRIAPLDWQGGRGRAVAWVVVNISERKRLEAELQRLANSDELTGLRNRRAFLQLAGDALGSAGPGQPPPPLRLALIDLDHFKAVNDRYGHLIGDAVLRHVAKALAEGVGPAAEVARIGGEEFAVLFHGEAVGQAAERLEAVRQHLRAVPLELGQERIAIDFSAGLCSAEVTDRHPSDLLRRADQYLYLAKQAGRGLSAYPGWIERRTR